MNKEKSIEWLKEIRSDRMALADDFIVCIDDIYALDYAINFLENDEWVDVRDRLPSESGWYLVTEYAPSEFITNIREFNLKHFVTDYAQVIAWKPLPQPYERKE